MLLIVFATILLVPNDLICSATDPLARQYGKLVFSSLLYRHGDRAITDQSYPNDPYLNKSYWPMGYGQLTNQGKERHYEFGQWIRNRYSDFLPVEYSNNDIYIRSTSVDRALMSAASNLAGLYPPNKVQQWNNNVGNLWQPIPIHSIPRDIDTSLSFGNNCPRFVEEFNSLKDLPYIQKFNENHQELYNYIREHTGLNLTNEIVDTSTLYDILLVETQFNYTLPNWTSTIFPQKLKEVAEFSFLMPTSTPLLKKLSCGVLLNEIVENMNGKRNGTLNPNVKLWVYSAHDTNVAGLLNSLNIYDKKLPPYTAAVFLELRKIENPNDTYVVTVSYRNSSTHDPYLLHVPGCDSVACDLDQFISVVKPLLVTNWYEECQKDPENNFFIYISIISVLVAVSIIFFIFNKKYFICYCGRDYQKLLLA
ncbi:prostatic acid phosphatase-like isoform X2 [Sipha flava]|uniref:acid phosphatase n=1 Tax=Sipha flava TaxID=143950 RepID=A0A8B8GTD0_9HEMI|nr:prostatic acid phosphatase-like isoform X2 [Sipha flava]